MGAIQVFLASSSSSLLLCMGVCATLGFLHWWLARERWDENRWIACWALLAFLFLGARGVQLTTEDPEAAIASAKVSFAVAPYLIWCLVGFARRLNGGRMAGGPGLFLGAASMIWTGLIMATPWFISPEVMVRTDFFGRTHISVEALWPTTLLGAYIGAIAVWGVRRIRKSRTLDPAERRVLLSGMGVYALLGIGAVLSGLGVTDFPAMAEYGPFVLAVCLSYLMVHRRRGMERTLEQLLAKQTSKLEASEARYRDLVENAPIAVLACDLEGHITAMNRRMMEMVGTPDSAPPLQTPLLEVRELAAAGLPELVEVCLERDNAVTAELGMESPYGSRTDLRVTASPLRDEQHARNGVLFLFEDVTEQSALEQKLRQSQKMESIGELASGIAHEINNPMAYVRANLGIMRESWSELFKDLDEAKVHDLNTPRIAEFESLIEESMEGVERTIAIATDMREFAHAGGEQRAAIDLREILEASVRLTNAFRPESVTIEESYGLDLMVVAAAGPLRQVFLNLLVNGLQAVGPTGRIWIQAQRRAQHVTVRIHDDGPGIPETARDRLFDPFFTTKSAGEGTGLGLYISYQIVESHGGEIRASNGPEGGACFEVRLPVLRET